ncbi:Hypothetical protein NCS54_01073000 [Fusarium falciforme]|uniref:Hypothetical protein n=1 Tax=Fusarium falciforme TaxID=195108 RepID=UPI0023016E06|nr:Hypothetical protein NCS54_01073000 [Fusarium falciforme]WAO93195.1 Hypothetical protein NCS54_01073000 [Fusarium falciforme]
MFSVILAAAAMAALVLSESLPSTTLAQLELGTFLENIAAIDFESPGNEVKVRKISDMSPQSIFLNDVTAVPGISDVVLVADSANGFIGRLELATGIFDTSTFRFHLEMDPVEGARLLIGVNDIQIRNEHLYWTNSFQACIYRIAITPTGFPAGVSFLDDFSFDVNGNIYASTNLDNSIAFIDAQSKEWKAVVGGTGEMTVAGSTSVAFGRGTKDKGVLYVSTSGAIATPVNGAEIEGAKVAAIDTKCREI